MLQKIQFALLIVCSLLCNAVTALAATDPVEVTDGTAHVLVEHVKEWHDCEAKGSQLIDVAHNGSYILFDVKATNAGYYTFTSAIATSLNDIGCSLGYVDGSGNYIESARLDIANSGSWTSTNNYLWNFYLEAGITYHFKMLCHAGSGYALNAFTIAIDAFIADVSLQGVNVNGFAVPQSNGSYTTTVFYDEDIQVEATPAAMTAEVSYTAQIGGADIAISNDGIIEKSQFNNGDEITVMVTVTDGPEKGEAQEINIAVTPNRKLQIRGTNENYGEWNTVSGSAVQSWTDYIYSFTPSAGSTRFSNGSWRPSGQSTQYGFYAKNTTVSIDIPSYYKIYGVTIIGYGSATFQLGSKGATVSPATTNQLSGTSDADHLETLHFNFTNHEAGSPLQLQLNDEYGRFYVVLHYQEVADISSPEFVTASIADNEQLSQVNNFIHLRFNEPVFLTENAAATLNDAPVNAKITNHVFATFSFWGLEYDNTYTLTLKAGSVQDHAGNTNQEDVVLPFSTGSKPAIQRKGFDFVIGVDGTADEAFAAANRYRGRDRFLIFVPNGNYELTGNSADHMTNLNRNNVSVIGQSMENAVLYNQPESYGISTTATLHLNNSGNGYFEDLTIKNNSGAPTGGQQVAIFDRGARNIFKHVKFFSWQDTYVSGDQGYHEECEIYGSVDYICGGGDQFFERCLLYNNGESGNKVTAPATNPDKKWGYVFHHCTIDGGRFVLGRPWQGEPRANYLYTKMHRQPDGNGYESMGGLPTHFYEYKSMDYDGNLLDLSARGNSPTSTNSYTPILTDQEAAEFTLPNVLGGEDGWLPSDHTYQTQAPVLDISGSTLSWQNNPEALCAVIFKDGVYHSNTTEDAVTLSENGTYTVQFANEMGGLGEAATLEVFSTAIDAIQADPENKNNVMYDLLGRPLKEIPQNGIYIKDGKKYYRLQNRHIY